MTVAVSYTHLDVYKRQTIGWLVGIAGRGIIESVDHWVAFILLGYIGGKMVYDAVKEAKSHEPKECRDPISFKMLMVMAIATSIDALATGIILPSVVGASTLLLMLTAVGLIGLTTFIISFAGVYIGKKFGDLFSSKAELLGGCLLYTSTSLTLLIILSNSISWVARETTKVPSSIKEIVPCFNSPAA